MEDLRTLSQKLQKGEISPSGLLKKTLSDIDKNNSKINAFISVNRELALADAEKSDARYKNGKALSPYDGIPIGIKDNIVQEGAPARCASRILDGFISPYSATAIEKLKSGGMIPLGSLNMDEFAMGSSTENSAYGITRNPHDAERSPGGSSGGSAAAVAAGFVPAALGSDTGGSIRQPASFCGITGLKPTYGSISRYGLVAFASSLDQIGPMTRSVEDCAGIFRLLRGQDPKDATTSDAPLKKSPSLSQLRIGIPSDLIANCDPQVRESFEKVLAAIRSQCAGVKEISLPNQKYANPVYYLTANSEASANLARFDGIRYGARAEGKTLEEIYINSRTAGFGEEVKRRILLGTFALSSGYYDAFYGKAQKVRALIRRDYERVFQEVDVVAMPVSPIPPFKIGEISDPVSMYHADLLTVGASLAGIPALAVPGPAAHGLPCGVQLQADFFGEELLFTAATAIEKQFPPVFAEFS